MNIERAALKNLNINKACQMKVHLQKKIDQFLNKDNEYKICYYINKYIMLKADQNTSNTKEQ